MAMPAIHITAGIAIARTIPNPWISIPVSFLSHILLDLYPEWFNKDGKLDRKEKAGIAIHALNTIAILAFMFMDFSWTVFACVFAANALDLWEAIYYCLRKTQFWWFHKGWWPARIEWQGFGMRPLQNAALDATLIALYIGVML